VGLFSVFIPASILLTSEIYFFKLNKLGWKGWSHNILSILIEQIKIYKRKKNGKTTTLKAKKISVQ
jgi:hypothetical protein